MINLKLSEMNLRDPFILPFEGKYYLYFQPGHFAWHGCDGFYVSTSRDLSEWSEPQKCFDPPEGFWATDNYWAPEVHYYNGKFYMVASFKAAGHMRASQILVSDAPKGPFVPSSYPITPNNWMCLDGTLYFEDGKPYMVFSHEWTQIKDGEICYFELSSDLTEAVSKPVTMFKASDAGWTTSIGDGNFVTDGPFLFRTKDNKLIMTWSSNENGRYSIGVAYSSNGSINGKWLHSKKTLSKLDGGHSMLFRAFDGQLYITMHTPNNPNGAERPRLFRVEEIPDEPFLKLNS